MKEEKEEMIEGGEQMVNVVDRHLFQQPPSFSVSRNIQGNNIILHLFTSSYTYQTVLNYKTEASKYGRKE
jgi:hypothetical protein